MLIIDPHSDVTLIKYMRCSLWWWHTHTHTHTHEKGSLIVLNTQQSCILWLNAEAFGQGKSILAFDLPHVVLFS